MLNGQEVHAIIREHGIAGVLVVLGVTARLFLADEPITTIRVIRSMVAGAFAGALMALALAGTDLSEPTKGAIIGVTALLAEDLVSLILFAGSTARDNPGAVFAALVDRFIRRK